MSNTDQDMSNGKTGRRNRKREQRRQKPGQPQGMETDQLLSPEPDRAQNPLPDPIENAPAAIETMAVAPEVTAIEPTAAADAVLPAALPINLRTIANAYGDYTLKSLEQTRSFVERLAGVRSLDTAMQVQSDYAKQAYATFVAETQKISGLHRELARQTLKPLEGFVARAMGGRL